MESLFPARHMIGTLAFPKWARLPRSGAVPVVAVLRARYRLIGRHGA